MNKNKGILIFCFFFSGACGLMYQVAWLRVLSLVFGNTTFATSTILSSYMAGLGLGALYFGKRIDKSKMHPLRAYAWLEGGVAVFAFMTPLLWKLIEWLMIGFYRGFEPSFIVLNMFKFVIAFAALFIPTFLMGGTLPIVSKYFVKRREETSKFVGFLYALNTFGAFFGVLFTGFYALYAIGVWQTVYLAGFLNLIIFVIFRKASDVGDDKSNEVADVTPVSPVESKQGEDISGVRGTLLFLFGCSGAVSMMYEVGWTRVLAMSLGSSVYAFSIMLATFLLGIAIGSYLFTRYSKRFTVTLRTFSVLQLLTALFVFLGINVFMDMPFYFVQVFKWAKADPAMMEVGKFMLCSMVMLPPTLVIGAMFTCFIDLYKGSHDLGQDVGTAYFSNTIGTILGAALTGFFVIPVIGIQQTLFVGAWINVVIGVAVFFLSSAPVISKKSAVPAVVALTVILAMIQVQPWDAKVISSDTAVKPDNLVHLSKQEFKDSFRGRDIIFYKEGHSATVSVIKARDNISLAVNGKVDASIRDGFTQYLLGHLPMILHPDPKKALVIGLGSASTVAAVAAHEVKEVHVVELEDAVVQAAPFFGKLNRNVLNDPRVKMFVNDGRNFLLMQPDKYDVIVSEPSNPWMAGVANLFSLEHFKTMKEHLSENGVACQWLHAYSMSPDDLAMIIHTFTQAFPYVQLWTSYYPDLMLVGYHSPTKLDFSQVQEKFKNPQMLADLGEYGVQTPESLLGSFWLDDGELRQIAKDASTHSDNKPLLEFSAPKSLYVQTLDKNYQYLDAVRSFDYNFLSIKPVPRQNLYLMQEVARSLLAKKMYRDALMALQVAVQIGPGNDPRTMEIDAILKYQLNDIDTAQVLLEQLLGRDGLSHEGFFYLGEIYSAKNRPDEARKLYERAVALNPNETKYQRSLANTLFTLEQFPQALKLYENILAVTGNDFDIIKQLVEIHLRISKMGVKVAALEHMAAAYPHYGPVFLQLGQIYESVKQYENSLQAFKRFAELAPEQAGAFINLARIYEKLGKADPMRRAMKRAVELNPDLMNNPQIKQILNP